MARLCSIELVATERVGGKIVTVQLDTKEANSAKICPAATNNLIVGIAKHLKKRCPYQAIVQSSSLFPKDHPLTHKTREIV